MINPLAVADVVKSAVALRVPDAMDVADVTTINCVTVVTGEATVVDVGLIASSDVNTRREVVDGWILGVAE